MYPACRMRIRRIWRPLRKHVLQRQQTGRYISDLCRQRCADAASHTVLSKASGCKSNNQGNQRPVQRLRQDWPCDQRKRRQNQREKKILAEPSGVAHKCNGRDQVTGKRPEQIQIARRRGVIGEEPKKEKQEPDCARRAEQNHVQPVTQLLSVQIQERHDESHDHQRKGKINRVGQTRFRFHRPRVIYIYFRRNDRLNA